MARRVALLVASYRYQDAGLRRLAAPQHDAEALAEVLRDPDVAGFDVTVLVNEPHYVVGEAIGTFFSDRRRDDLTVLYFSGHGLKDDQGRLYLAMTNTKRERLPWTALAAEQISEAMEACRSGQKVLVLDCCYSGAFPAGWAAKTDPVVHTLEKFGGKGRAVLTASDATQYSFEGEHLTGEGSRSVFTRCLVEGLRTGQADLDGDGDISLDDLYSYVHDRVVEEMPQQRPKKQENLEGRIVIARNVHWQLPGYLRNAIGSPISTNRLTAVDGLGHLYGIGNDHVRTSVLDQVQLLTEDDSRAVSAAATSLLRVLLPEQTRLAFHYDHGCAAVDTGRWDKAIEHFTAVTETDPGYRDVAAKLEQARTERSLARLRTELADLARAQRWGDVLTVWDRIQKIQPNAADPDGIATDAREQVRRQRETEREAERAQAERQRRVRQLQTELRTRSEARDWSAVLAFSEQLAELDPTAADPDGLATTARTQLEHRQDVGGSPAAQQTEAVSDQLAVQRETGPLTRSDTPPALRTQRTDQVPVPPQGSESWARRIRSHRWSRHVLIGLALVVLVVLSLTVRSTPLVRTLSGHTDVVHTVAVTPDGRQVVSGSGDDTVRVWDLATGRLARIVGGDNAVWAVALTPDGRQAVSGGSFEQVNDGSYRETIRVWELATGRLVRTLTGHTDKVNAVAVTPDGRQVVSGSWDDTVRVWDLATGRLVRTLTGHTSDITDVAVTPDGRQAVSGSEDDTVRVWDLATGRLARIVGGDNAVRAVAVTPDGRQAVSGSEDDTVRVWDLATGRLVRTLTGHTHQVNAVAVTPDGRQAVSGSTDDTVRVWDLATGRLVRTLTGHTSYITDVAVTPDGRQAVSGSEDKTVRVWDLAW